MNRSEQVAIWVKQYYGYTGELSRLPGYDDENFLLSSGTKKYVVKLTKDIGLLPFVEAQQAAIQHLSKAELTAVFPQHIANHKGNYITVIPQPESPSILCRLVEFLPGLFWAERRLKSEQLLKNLGRFVGKMDAVLADFEAWATHRYLDWDIQNCLDWQKHIHLLPSFHQRRLVDYFLLQFEMQVKPKLSQLRRQVIHNDVNDWNVLVVEKEIAGLIDFGDIVYAPLINNLAITLTYVLLDAEDPLRTASMVIEAYHKQYALLEIEVELLYYLIAARLCVSVLHAAVQRDKGSENPHHFLTDKQAWNLLEKWIRINPLKAEHHFRSACKFKGLFTEKANYKNLLEKRNKRIGRNLSISYQNPLKIVKGALQYLYDDQGNTYVDCVNNVSHVGHCHPQVVRAMQKQLATLNTNTRYLHDKLIAYADLLCSTLPRHLKVCYFVNSGSEANDLAVRMARQYIGAKDVIVLDHAYHGTSTLALEMSPYKFDGPGGFEQPDYIHKAQVPDNFRGPYTNADAGQRYAADVQRIIEHLKENNKKPAAFICETLLGVGGQIPLPENYLPLVYDYIHEAGGVAIADEVQVGFGRVGKTFWGFELQNAKPDIVVIGKPMGNGHPLAAVVVTTKIAKAFNNGMEYFNTFGGNPVSMVAGEAVLKVILDEQLQHQAEDVGTYLQQQLANLQKNHTAIADVRGRGLFVGVEFVKDSESLTPDPETPLKIVESMRDRGFLLSTDGPFHNVLKLKPPLVFTKKNVDELTDNLQDVLTQLAEA